MTFQLLFAIALLMMTCFAHGQTAPATRAAGVELLPGGTESLELMGNHSNGSRRIIAVEGQSFSQAIRATTDKTQIDPWDLQLGARIAAPVEKGDVILASFFFRHVKSMTGSATTEFCFERAGAPHTKSTAQVVSAGPEWQRIDLPFVAAESYAPGEAQVLFRMGYHAPQAFELADVRVVNYGKNIDINQLPRTRFWYEGHEPDAPLEKDGAGADRQAPQGRPDGHRH